MPGHKCAWQVRPVGRSIAEVMTLQFLLNFRLASHVEFVMNARGLVRRAMTCLLRSQ